MNIRIYHCHIDITASGSFSKYLMEWYNTVQYNTVQYSSVVQYSLTQLNYMNISDNIATRCGFYESSSGFDLKD